jgi:hypothetical protein
LIFGIIALALLCGLVALVDYQDVWTTVVIYALRWPFPIVVCTLIIIRERRLTIDRTMVVRFLIALGIAEVIVIFFPWDLFSDLLDYTATTMGIFVLYAFTMLLKVIVSSGVLYLAAMVTTKEVPNNTRLFTVRYVLLCAATSIVFTVYAITGSLIAASAGLFPDELPTVVHVFDGFFTQIISGVVYYFVVVSFFSQTRPVRLFRQKQ